MAPTICAYTHVPVLPPSFKKKICQRIYYFILDAKYVRLYGKITLHEDSQTLHIIEKSNPLLT